MSPLFSLFLLVLSANAGPEFSEHRGLYSAPLSLEITPADGGSIRYSLDGSAPDVLLSGPLIITTTATVSSTSWGGGWVYYGSVGGAQALWVR